MAPNCLEGKINNMCVKIKILFPLFVCGYM